MLPRFSLIHPAMLLLALAGCANITEKPVNNIQQTVNQEKFQVKKNPNPKEAYEFTVTLKDAPDNLEAVSAYAHYIIPDCRYDTNKLMGARANFQATISVPFEKVSSNVYKGTVYFDALLDEDYLNQGKPCHWQWRLLGMNFEPNPNISMVRYSGRVTSSDKVSNGLYRQEGYITLWKYNQLVGKPMDKKFTLHVSPKEQFGKEQQQHLATISYEVRKK
ncbi:hypothetical protein LVJ86_04610 [Neisseria arctica]|nr:hypothetical protein [Neisseria arctica]UOO87532.1 hypothetical protein LVJ86_04610 [Neisseria arctica]